MCQSRRCIPSISFFGRAGACCCSVPMKLLTAFGGLHLIGIPGNSRWRECSILRAAVYDLDKLAFAGFRREKRTGGWPLIVTTSQFRLVSTTHIYKFIIRTSGRKLLLHVRREIYYIGSASVSPESKSPVKSLKIRKLITKLWKSCWRRDEVVRRDGLNYST